MILCSLEFSHRLKQLGYTTSEMSVFTLEDFVGQDEIAHANAQLAWGSSIDGMRVKTFICPVCKCEDLDGKTKPYLSFVEYHRHKMIDADDPWAYLEKTMQSNGDSRRRIMTDEKDLSVEHDIVFLTPSELGTVKQFLQRTHAAVLKDPSLEADTKQVFSRIFQERFADLRGVIL